ncbi:hypothetical protein HPB49_025098 [Dermacentor silvarum]|uniref:Uncharacterized protein n=1 Tax=Dermacentor silvarum TaxID=543639 RepID=A0ACB8CIQ0_DERSI|nr:hypothetical protein HPB49_025098 [Dermacentor silvarum]
MHPYFSVKLSGPEGCEFSQVYFTNLCNPPATKPQRNFRHLWKDNFFRAIMRTHLRWPLPPPDLTCTNWTTGRGPNKEPPWWLPWCLGRAHLPPCSSPGHYLKFACREPSPDWPIWLASWSTGAALWPYDHSFVVATVAAMYQGIEQALCVKGPRSCHHLRTSSRTTGSARQPSREGQVLYLYFPFPRIIKCCETVYRASYGGTSCTTRQQSLIRHLQQKTGAESAPGTTSALSVGRSFRSALLAMPTSLTRFWRPLPSRSADGLTVWHHFHLLGASRTTSCGMRSRVPWYTWLLGEPLVLPPCLLRPAVTPRPPHLRSNQLAPLGPCCPVWLTPRLANALPRHYQILSRPHSLTPRALPREMCQDHLTVRRQNLTRLALMASLTARRVQTFLTPPTCFETRPPLCGPSLESPLLLRVCEKAMQVWREAVKIVVTKVKLPLDSGDRSPRSINPHNARNIQRLYRRNRPPQRSANTSILLARTPAADDINLDPFTAEEVAFRLERSENTAPGEDRLTYHHWKALFKKLVVSEVVTASREIYHNHVAHR